MNKPKSLIALDIFLGMSAADTMKSHGVSTRTATDAKAMYIDKRNDMLAYYYLNGQDREKVREKFEIAEPTAVGAVDDKRLEIMERAIANASKAIDATNAELDELRCRVKQLEEGTAYDADYDDRNPPIGNAPQGPFGHAPRTPKQDERAIEDYDDADPRRHALENQYFINVTDGAVKDWKELIDSHADIEAIRRRIVGGYYNGRVIGKGQRYKVHSVNKWDISVICLDCVSNDQARSVYIANVAKLPITEA